MSVQHSTIGNVNPFKWEEINYSSKYCQYSTVQQEILTYLIEDMQLLHEPLGAVAVVRLTITLQSIPINATTSEAGTAYPSGAPEFTPSFQWGSCYSIFSSICMFCWSLFVLLYFFLWSLCCLFFFDIRILNAPLVSSNSS